MYLDKDFINLVDNGVIPSVNYGVINKDSKYIFKYGYKNIYNNKELLKETNIYDLASLSKVIGTNTGILKLIDSGKIQLNTKVNSILKGYIDEDMDIEDL